MFDTLFCLVQPDRSTSAAILAGGSARRLGGANKAALPVGGARIIDRQLDVLRRVAHPVFVVANDPAPYIDLGIDIVADARPGTGVLGGIYTAILASPRDRVLVVACDMPFLDARLLERLIAVRGADLVIPKSRTSYEPLCAVYGKACAAPILRRIDAGLRRAAVLPEGVRIEEIGPEVLAEYDPHGLLFVNVNTPHDYERAQDQSALKPQMSRDRITERNR